MFYSIAPAPIPSPIFEWLDAPANKYGLGFSTGIPLTDQSRLPSIARQKDKKPLYDVMALPSVYVVSFRFRDAIEKIEPNRHQFFPVILEALDGQRHDGSWFILNICGRIPVLIPDQPLKYPWTVPQNKPGELGGGLHEPYYFSLDAKNCSVSKPAAGDHRLFRSWVFLRPSWICSASIISEMKRICRGGRAAGEYWDVFGLEITPLADTDEPWLASKHADVWLNWALKNPGEVERLGYQRYVE